MSDSSIQKGKIIIYPTKIVIEGYYERNPFIESKLNVWNGVTHSYDFQAFIKVNETKIIIPTGFDIYLLRYFYPLYKVIDKRNEINKLLEQNKNIYSIKMKYDFRDELQKNAYNFLNAKVPRVKYRFMQRYLCLETGKGKTYVTVRSIVDNKDRPIIFVGQDSLCRQWIERIVEYTDTTEDEIYYISGQKSIDKIMKMTDEEIFKIKFFICCYRTLTNKLKVDTNSKAVSQLLEKIRINLKVFDEAHIEYMAIFSMDMISHVRTIYLSATPFRSDYAENKVYQKIFENVDHFYSNEENYHNVVIYKWDSKPLLQDQLDCDTKYGFSMPRYFKFIEQQRYDEFFRFICFLLFDFILKNRKKKKIVLLIGINSLIDKVYTDLIKYVEENGYNLKIGKFNGTVKKEERLAELNENDIVISTDKSFSNGMDLKGLQFLINTVPFSAEAKVTQLIGRLRRIPGKEVVFVDTCDNGFRAIKTQTDNKFNKIYKKSAKKIYMKSYNP